MTKIMLVEDDKSLREIYSIRLAAEGYSIALAGDGEEALSVVVQEKPDLIIADVMMPKISGFDMLDILRSQPETKNIKVIMMTALSSEDQRQRGEQLGAEKYLVKSQVGIEDVITAVHEVLGDKANQNAQANVNIVKTVSDVAQANQTKAIADTPTNVNATIVTPTGQNPPSAPVAPQGPITPPQNSEVNQTVNFNSAPIAMPVATVAMPQLAVGAPNVPVTTSSVSLNPNFAIQQANLQAIQQMYSQLQSQNTTLKPADRVLPNAQLAEAIAMREQTVNQPKKQEKGASERVIEPIHDMEVDNRRDEIQRQMEAMLGNENGEIVAPINSRNMNKINNTASVATKNTPPAQNNVIASAQDLTSQNTPSNPMPNTAQPVAIEVAQNTAQQVQEKMAHEEVNKTATIMQAMGEDLNQQSTTQNEETSDPRRDAEKASEEKLKQELLDKPLPKIDEIADPGIAVTIKAAQPGYLSELENQLSNDNTQLQNVDPNSMMARMNAELADDQLTIAAQEKAKANQTDEPVSQATTPATTLIQPKLAGPNIQSSEPAQQINAQSSEAAPQPIIQPSGPQDMGAIV